MAANRAELMLFYRRSPEPGRPRMRRSSLDPGLVRRAGEGDCSWIGGLGPQAAVT